LVWQPKNVINGDAGARLAVERQRNLVYARKGSHGEGRAYIRHGRKGRSYAQRQQRRREKMNIVELTSGLKVEVQVEAVVGDLWIHRSIVVDADDDIGHSEDWVVTHSPSGLRFPYLFPTPEAATRAAKEASEIADWHSLGMARAQGASPNVMADVKDICRKHGVADGGEYDAAVALSRLSSGDNKSPTT
jgi:hypothetical protein